MNVSALSSSDLEYRLGTAGISIQTGSFITRLRTSIRSVADGIGLLYADYPLVVSEGFADFHVRLAPPDNVRRWFKPQVLFTLDGIPPFKPLPLDQAFPMFEWGLNWCVSNHANNYLIIHAAVVEKGGYAAILPAPPGSGKSTLCAALVNRGWRLLSDELALIRVSDGLVVPLPRPISLKNESIEIMRQYEPDAVFSRETKDTMKGTVAHMKPRSNCVTRASEAARAAWVIFPKYSAGAKASLEAVPSSRAFIRMADSAFNYSLLGAAGFETLMALIDTSLCYDFTYSVLDDAIDAFAALTPSAKPK